MVKFVYNIRGLISKEKEKKVCTASSERGGVFGMIPPLIKLVPNTHWNHTLKKNNEKRSSLICDRELKKKK